MKKPNHVIIFDTTLRDGEQCPGASMGLQEKLQVARQLEKLKVDIIEAGFPAASPGDFEAVKRVAAEIKKCRIAGLARCVKKDIDACAEALKPAGDRARIHVFLATSAIHREFKLKKAKDEIIRQAVEGVSYAKRFCEDIEFSPEDASRTEPEFLAEVVRAVIAAGATTINIPDTVGFTVPQEFRTLLTRLHEMVPELKNVVVHVHCHNDLGMAVACSVAGAKAAIDAGVDAYINTTVNGMGERAGNADLVSVILAIKYADGLCGKYKLDEKIDLRMAWKICHYASYAFGVPIPINQVGVGKNAFAHASGIHVDGALKDSRNYELYDFEELGRGGPEIVETGRMILMGEYSGIKGLRNVYGKLAIKFKDDAEARKILELARYANVENQLPLTDEELIFIAQHPDEVRELLTLTP